MKKISEINVNYSFKSRERKLIHLAFKAIRNQIPLYIREEDFNHFREVFEKVSGHRKKMRLKTGDGQKFRTIRADYRKRVTKNKMLHSIGNKRNKK